MKVCEVRNGKKMLNRFMGMEKDLVLNEYLHLCSNQSRLF